MPTISPLKQLTLIGVGLIGGSFVLDLKRQRLVEKVVGIDIDADNLERALERKVIDEGYTTLCQEAVIDADFVVIATPVTTLGQICATLAPLLSLHTVVSDVGSTKQSAVEAFRQHLPKHFANCIATHPIAGSDRHGALAAQFGLYQDKKLVICPHEQQSSHSLQLTESLWKAVGAEIYTMTVAEHDAVFAAVSHLPHLLAYAYMQQIAEAEDKADLLAFAASGFRDFTRIASSHPAIWADICLANRHSLQTLMAQQQQQLARLSALLEESDRQGLYDYFQTAKAARDEWQSQQ